MPGTAVSIEIYGKEETDGGCATARNRDLKISARSVVARDEQEGQGGVVFFGAGRVRGENRSVLFISLAFLRILPEVSGIKNEPVSDDLPGREY
jgi:hypothetical protein